MCVEGCCQQTGIMGRSIGRVRSRSDVVDDIVVRLNSPSIRVYSGKIDSIADSVVNQIVVNVKVVLVSSSSRIELDCPASPALR